MNAGVQQAWLEFCRQPSEETFGAFYEGTKGFIFTICLRVLGNEDEARDVLQTVYTQLLTIAHSGAEGLEVADVDELVRKLTLRFADTQRKRVVRNAQRMASSEILDFVESNDTCTRTLVANAQIQDAVRQAIDGLAPDLRSILLMQYDEGMTHQQIAERMSISRPHVTRLANRAVSRVESLLKAQGIVQSAITLLVVFLGRELLLPTVGARAAAIYSHAVQSYTSSLSASAHASRPVYAKAAALLKGKAAAYSAVACVAAILLTMTVLPSLYKQRIVAASTEDSPTPAGLISNPRRHETTTRILPAADTLTPSAATAPANPDSGGLAGTVFSRHNHMPLGNVRIHLSRATAQGPAIDPRYATVTDPNGNYAIRNVASGEYFLHATPEQPWVPEVTTAPIVAQEVHHVGPIQLNRLGAIFGRVVTGEDEQPVPNVRVQAQTGKREVEKEVITDADGRFALTGLTLPFYAVDLPTKGYSRSLQLEAGKDSNLVVRLGNAAITGTATRNGSASPAAYVYCQRNEENGFTSYYTVADKEGSYSLSGLPAGKWLVEAMPEDLKAQQKATTIIEANDSSPVIWNPEIPSGILAGTAHHENGAALANVLIHAQPITPTALDPHNGMPSSYETSSTSAGTFEFASLNPGKYLLSTVTTAGLVAISKPVEVQVSGRSTADVLATETNSGAVRSTALSLSMEQPLQQAWCMLQGPGGPLSITHSRGADGVLHVRGLQPGRYIVSVSAHGYTAATHEINIEANKTEPIVDVLEDAGAFRWVLFNADGLGRAGVQCRLDPAPQNTLGKFRAGTTGEDGTWPVRGLTPGLYTATAILGSKTCSLQIAINQKSITENRTQLQNALQKQIAHKTP